MAIAIGHLYRFIRSIKPSEGSFAKSKRLIMDRPFDLSGRASHCLPLIAVLAGRHLTRSAKSFQAANSISLDIFFLSFLLSRTLTLSIVFSDSLQRDHPRFATLQSCHLQRGCGANVLLSIATGMNPNCCTHERFL
jgi:hypothetical protein